MRIAILLAFIAAPAAAQVAFDPAAAKACLSAARTSGEAAPACVGEAAARCMEAPGGDTTSGMIDCYVTERDWWDARLNEAYRALHQRREAQQADLSPRDTPLPLDSLVAMERAWISWRDALCAYQGSDYPGGSLARVLMAQCEMVETARQALRLSRDLDAAGTDR